MLQPIRRVTMSVVEEAGAAPVLLDVMERAVPGNVQAWPVVWPGMLRGAALMPCCHSRHTVPSGTAGQSVCARDVDVLRLAAELDTVTLLLVARPAPRGGLGRAPSTPLPPPALCKSPCPFRQVQGPCPGPVDPEPFDDRPQ